MASFSYNLGQENCSKMIREIEKALKLKSECGTLKVEEYPACYRYSLSVRCKSIFFDNVDFEIAVEGVVSEDDNTFDCEIKCDTYSSNMYIRNDGDFTPQATQFISNIVLDEVRKNSNSQAWYYMMNCSFHFFKNVVLDVNGKVHEYLNQ